jgi:hypothetical protein
MSALGHNQGKCSPHPYHIEAADFDAAIEGIAAHVSAGNAHRMGIDI